MAAIPAVRIIRHASTPGTPVTGRALLTPQSSMSSASGHGRDLRSPELGSTRSLSTVRYHFISYHLLFLKLKSELQSVYRISTASAWDDQQSEQSGNHILTTFL